ncbi:trehalose-phosphatase [Rhizorhapis suberifaciens]|uniref:Trehalose 6-phosphate phosphatase n=1 Tax=Rhizorhapis suberifaciens TaxID=13656 RepID=A0A840HRQ6_9SPHN|nr:trehalose-phosphatase [Rhizorhapis suberifaciens]MBB4640280.1 trehalose 6-phosphate phosphatase [Rhizorhapis suberifaciens]
MIEKATPILDPPPYDLLGGAFLFLDFDGTLVELAPRPQDVTVEADLRNLLGRLQDRLDGRLAIVSGRSVATLRAMFGLGDYLLAGSHGLELAYPGCAPEAPVRPPSIDQALRELICFAEGKNGLVVEEKTLGVAIHYRLAPQQEDECRSICEALSVDTGLYLQHGKMMFELRPGNGGKGTAVTRLLAETEPNGVRPIFIGDDITDEDGFMAAARLAGSGILVGSPRITAANYRLDSVTAARRWLSRGEEQLRKGG